jgi:TonB-linked SusC/RagA family outer membrane protein
VNRHVVGAVPRVGRGLLAVVGGALLAVSTVQAQRQVSGRVVDAQGNVPVPGASVTVTGTTLGAVTNDSGGFQINGVPTTATTLNARRIGYRQTSIPLAADQGAVTIAMTQDVLQLEAQVITGTATSISSRNSANDVPVLNSDQVNRVPSPTIENAIQGKIPGALVEQNNGGAPGGGLQIQIRGVTSINANASPLYVIDGIVVDNETINSGANAITGAGNNTITQDPQDNSPNRIADINPNDIESIEVLKGASAAAIYGSRAGSGVVVITTKKGTPGKARWDVTGRAGTFTPANTLNLRTFPTLASVVAWDNTYSLPLSDTVGYKGNQDFQDQVFGGGQASYEGDLSVRGQAGGTQYFASAISKYDNGVMLNTGYNKQGGRVNLTQAFSPSLTAGINLYYQHSLARRGITGNDNVGIAPYNIFSVTPQFFNMSARNPDGSYVHNPWGFANAIADAYQIQTPEESQRFIGGGNVNWRIFTTERQSLNLSALAGSDLVHQADRFYSPPELQVEQHKALDGTVTALTGDITYLNYGVNLVHHYAGGVNLDATTSIGMGRDRRSYSNPYQVGQGLPPGIKLPSAAQVQSVFDSLTGSKTMSLYIQEQLLTLNQRLTIQGGLTGERSTNNGDINKYYAFPKAAVAFRVPQFVGFLDEFKLRGAWGRSGTDPIFGVRYPDLQNLNFSLDNGLGGLRTNLVANDPNIKPETNTEIETGFDATMFNSRAQLTFTVYQKRVTNLLLEASVQPSAGIDAQWINGGQFTNKGAEISLAVTPLQMHNGLTWVTTTTFARNYSVVDVLPVPGFAAGNQFGGPFGSNWIQQGKSVSWVVNTNFTNAAGVPLGVGNAQPDYIMSFGNSFDFQHFHLFGQVDWRRGGTTANLTDQYFDFGPGSGLLADSAASARRFAAFQAGLTPWVEPATYLKVRELTLSYDLPSWLVNRFGMVHLASARLQVSGRNLFAIYKYTGLDPETSNFGNSNIARSQEVTPYPPARSVFVTLDLGF